MLVLLAIILVVFFAYALSFDKLSDALPKSVSMPSFTKPTPEPETDTTPPHE